MSESNIENHDAPLVSVIVPAYNVDGYVSNAIGSLLNQTLRDIEVIVIDDGSTDATGSILQSMSYRDPRLVVLTVDNGGAAKARNIGLTHATGKYVYFADADDWAYPTALETMTRCAERDDAELVIAGFEIDTYMRPNLVPSLIKANIGEDDFGTYSVERKTVAPRVYRDRVSFRKAACPMFDKNLLYTPWNKLFLRSRIEENGFQFREGDFWDDFPFCLDYIRDVDRVVTIPDIVYRFRRIRSNSETTRWRDCYEKREEEHSWMIDLYRHWELLTDKDVDEMLHRRYIERVVGCIESVCDPASGMDAPARRRRIGRMMETGRVENALLSAQPKSTLMRVMLLPMRLGSVKLMEAEGRIISLAKRRTPELFATLKAIR